MKIIISSTFVDLKEFRRVTINMLSSLMCKRTGDIVAMEFFDANAAPSSDVCLDKIRGSDLVIGIYGNRYGSVAATDPEGRSMTELEFDEAKLCGKPILTFVANDIETEAEDPQKRFIQNKVFNSGITSARFDLDDLNGFADRLNSSLKIYFNGLNGYEYNSVWEDIRELKEKFSNDDSFPRLIPYEDNEELKAFKAIERAAASLLAVVDDLVQENNIVHNLAYDYDNACFENIEEHKKNVLNEIKQNSSLILRNWETADMGIVNHVKRIQLSTYYLKLCYVQNRLLKENWTETLRQEILSVKQDYINFINKKSMLID